MIRHLAELSALLLCFAVGVGLLAAFVIGLLMIWRPEFTTTAGEDEYRRVEDEGTGGAIRETLHWVEGRIETLEHFPICASRPYNWATREPMVWNVPHA